MPLQSSPPRSWRRDGPGAVMCSWCTDRTSVAADGLSDKTALCANLLTHHTHYQTTNASSWRPHSLCVCVCALRAHINVIQGESWRIDNLCLIDPLMLSRKQERRFIISDPSLQHPSPPPPLRFRKVSVILWVLCILWHGTEVKLCRALWSYNAVDMGRTPVCRWGLVGFIRSLLNYWTS